MTADKSKMTINSMLAQGGTCSRQTKTVISGALCRQILMHLRECNATSDWIKSKFCDSIFYDIQSETQRHEQRRL